MLFGGIGLIWLTWGSQGGTKMLIGLAIGTLD